jgi:hypothetical protein
MARACIFLAVFLVALSGVGCAPLGLASSPTPKPTATAIEAYMYETSDYYESLAAATDLIKKRIAEEQNNSSLFDDKTWRQDMAGALQRIHRAFQTVSHAPPPQGTEEYHQAMIEAETHTNAVADFLQAWLDSRDEGKLKQAQQELAASDVAHAQAQKMLDDLLKGK